MTMDRDELTRQLESMAGSIQYQVLNNLDELLAPVVKEGKLSKEALEMMVKRPLMHVVTKMRSLRLTTQNPGFERKKENGQ
jgi:hypothetical protein